MKIKLSSLSALVLAGLIVSCSSSPKGFGSKQLSSQTLTLVRNAVFEVVLEKQADDPVVYERELNWSKVPYAIRNDKYHSIGTAFAISKTELVTAFHVINLGFESLVYNQYCVRDSKGNVYEVDQVTGGSNEKDYLIFTVKGKTFDEYFQFERNYKVGDPVLSIGNALGEGIVVRDGLVLGTVPEEDSGRWDLLKSSADGNPGNSGGPLVTPNGKVIALVAALRDNILYSIPAEVILEGSRSALAYRIKPRFGHLLLANRLEHIFETSVPLPDSYTGARSAIRRAYLTDYDAAMSALFNEAPEYLTGPNNAYLLNDSPSSSFPEVSFVDPNDNNWKLSNLNVKSYSLDDDGRLAHTQVSGIDFYKIRRPVSVSAEKLSADPKYIMDLILQNIRTDRTLWGGEKFRILSYGDPSSTGRYVDAMGRTWLTAYWIIGFEDEVRIMYIMPMPNGPALIGTSQSSSLLHDYEWDLQKICDHVFVGYDGTFEDWNNFITQKEFVPDFFRGLRFEWANTERNFSFSCEPVSINAGTQVFEWTNASELFLVPSWYRQNNEPEFGIRKLVLNKDRRGKEFIVLYRNIKPDIKLGSNAMENWNDIAAEKYPFDGKAAISVKDNAGSIGAILGTRQPGTDTLHSLYLSMENPQDEENLNRRFNALRQGVMVNK